MTPPRAELHFHLLPGVDDGPISMADSVALARLAVADGTRQVAVTPHAGDVVIGELGERVAAVGAALEASGVELELMIGAELMAGHVLRLGDDELATIALGPADAPFQLLEGPFSSRVDGARAGADRLRTRGYDVLVAHPERCSGWFQSDAAPLAAEVQAGGVLQITAGSLTGAHGGEACDRAFELVGTGWPALVASDAHGARYRPPALSDAHAALLDGGVPRERADELVDLAPARALREGLGAVVASAGAARRAA